ncbi:hypothetical protein RvY_11691 [Ramazzottius varieornatus]|uniref:Uncharacterized protein n=1 Tax=Ramazzottius varieornatus TaxID=947166 RepID=A0A1D1VMD0_RAMVA|nr:hypothetical protein RvY_11691 [Ramazzottius varieornatus]
MDSLGYWMVELQVEPWDQILLLIDGGLCLARLEGFGADERGIVVDSTLLIAFHQSISVYSSESHLSFCQTGYRIGVDRLT